MGAIYRLLNCCNGDKVLEGLKFRILTLVPGPLMEQYGQQLNLLLLHIVYRTDVSRAIV